MNTEEMLSLILENQKQMQQQMQEMQQQIQQISDNQKKIDERFDKVDKQLEEHYNMIYQLVLNRKKMQKDINAAQYDINSIELETEDVILPSIMTLCAMQICNAKRITKLEGEVRDFKDELTISEILYKIKHNKML